MSKLQKAVILLWMVGVVAATVWPPWTVHEVLLYRSGSEIPIYATPTQFRYLLSPPEWEVYTRGDMDPIVLKFSGRLRFDLLAVEIFLASVVAAGLWFMARKDGDRV